MAGARITVTVEDHEVRRLFRELGSRMINPKPVLAVIGEILVASVQENFEQHRSPDGAPWKQVSEAYAAWKTRSKGRNSDDVLILNRILMGSINRRVAGKSVAVGTSVPYGAVHQFGGRTGRGRSAEMPARPYLGVRKEDWSEIKAAVELFLIRGLQ